MRAKTEELPGSIGAFIAKDPAEARKVMIEGPAGILKVCPPWDAPRHNPSLKQLSWPNGTVAHVYSSEEYEELRGPQHHWAWCDEPAKWRNADETWEQVLFGLRLGDNPEACLTTTPRPIKLIRDLLKDPLCFVTNGSTYDNRANLSKVYESIIRKFEGTRLGRQELYAALLDDTPGALWTYTLIDKYRLPAVPKGVELVRVVVAIDPSATEEGNAAGIVGAAQGSDGHGYVLADKTLNARPEGWAKEAVDLLDLLQGDLVVAEINNGGQMVEGTIRAYRRDVPYKEVHASRGKITRAEPISLLYERGLIHHVGSYPELEDEMCTYEPVMMEKRKYSPNRMDALVWAMTELFATEAADLQDAFFGASQMSSSQAPTSAGEF